jgi:Uma2 family endonuclease
MSTHTAAVPVMPVSTSAPIFQGPPQGQWSLADWETLPDDGVRYEIVRGTLYMSTAPSSFHQWIISRFYRLVGIPAEEQRIAYTFFSPIGVILSETLALQPDLALVKMDRRDIIRDRRIMGAPDLVVEVISPGSADYDEQIKRLAYAEAGVPEYVIIDPAAMCLSLFTLEAANHSYIEKRFEINEVAHFECAPGISLRVGDLFEDAPDTAL